jgi:hypothetical protein
MTQIKAKIYYDISSEKILDNTFEMEGDVEETTKEEDINSLEGLKGKKAEDVDFIEVPYGTLDNVRALKFNTTTGKWEVEYHLTADEFNFIQSQEQSSTVITQRISNISTYLINNIPVISEVENLISSKASK